MTAPDTSWCKRGGSRGYVTVKPVPWFVGKKNAVPTFVIPVGTEFESSVPWALQWILSPDNPFYLLSACIHDWMLEHKYSAACSGAEWYDAAKKSGASKFQRITFALAVWGFTLWRRK